MHFAEELAAMNLAQLRELEGQVEKQIVKTERRTYDEAAEQILRIAHEVGVPLQTLLNRTGVLRAKSTAKDKAPRRQREPSTVVYQHPSDPSKKWGGYGPHPKWLKELTRDGGTYTLEQLRVSE